MVALALLAGFVGYRLYKKLTTNTVVAYFPEANALYSGDKVQIMGVRVGSVDKIEPAGDKMKVTFHYDNKYKVPANASAVIVNPTLVASRSIQLEPPYKGGPVMADNAVIPIERTQVPTEWDQLRESVANVISKLGPTPEQPKGPFGDVIESFADGLAGKGKQINTTLDSLSRALTALNEGRGDFFAVVHSLALFVNALHKDDQQFVALNTQPGPVHRQVDRVRPGPRQCDTAVRRPARHPAPVLGQEPRGAHARHRQPRQLDHHAGPTRAAEWFGDRPARPADAGDEPQPDLPPVARRGHVHPGDPELREPNAVHVQHDSGR